MTLPMGFKTRVVLLPVPRRPINFGPEADVVHSANVVELLPRLVRLGLVGSHVCQKHSQAKHMDS